MKRLICLFACLLVVCLLPLRAEAASGTTTVTFEVPATHTISLTIQGRGTVQLGQKTYASSTTLDVDRLSTWDLTITPAKGYVIRSIVLDGVSLPVTPAGQTLTLADIVKNVTLSVTFDRPGWDSGSGSGTASSTNPRTGDPIALPLAVLCLTAAALPPILKRKP